METLDVTPVIPKHGNTTVQQLATLMMTNQIINFPHNDSIPDDKNHGATSLSGTLQFISTQDLFIIKAVFNAILTQAFCILGCATNILNVVVFYKIGFSETINISLTALAVSDFFSCFILIWRNIALNPWFQQIQYNLPFETNEISYLTSLWPHIAFVSATKLLTASISVERCICVTMPLKVKSIFTKTRVRAFCIVCFLVVFLPFVPMYTTHRYDWKFSPLRNRTLVGLIVSTDDELINRFAYMFINIVFSQIPFIVISISTIFLVTSLRRNSKWRQKTTVTVTISNTNSNNTNPNPGVAGKSSSSNSKENRVSKLVVTVGVLFIACFLPAAVSLILQTIYPGLSLTGRYANIFIMLGAVIFFVECVNSSCNIFIYYRFSSVYKKTFDEIFTRKTKAVHKL